MSESLALELAVELLRAADRQASLEMLDAGRLMDAIEGSVTH